MWNDNVTTNIQAVITKIKWSWFAKPKRTVNNYSVFLMWSITKSNEYNKSKSIGSDRKRNEDIWWTMINHSVEEIRMKI